MKCPRCAGPFVQSHGEVSCLLCGYDATRPELGLLEALAIEREREAARHRNRQPRVAGVYGR